MTHKETRNAEYWGLRVASPESRLAVAEREFIGAALAWEGGDRSDLRLGLAFTQAAALLRHLRAEAHS